MNNQAVEWIIKDATLEVENIGLLIESLGPTSKPVPFLTKYTLIKACGTIEQSFKGIVADFFNKENIQVQTYVDNTIRESSMNPTYSNICNTLEKFDPNWNSKFKAKINSLTESEKILSSLASLNKQRNAFAHGRPVTQSFDTLKGYFDDAKKIIEILDDVVH